MGLLIKSVIKWVDQMLGIDILNEGMKEQAVDIYYHAPVSET